MGRGRGSKEQDADTSVEHARTTNGMKRNEKEKKQKKTNNKTKDKNKTNNNTKKKTKQKKTTISNMHRLVGHAMLRDEGVDDEACKVLFSLASSHPAGLVEASTLLLKLVSHDHIRNRSAFISKCAAIELYKIQSKYGEQAIGASHP